MLWINKDHLTLEESCGTSGNILQAVSSHRLVEQHLKHVAMRIAVRSNEVGCSACTAAGSTKDLRNSKIPSREGRSARHMNWLPGAVG